MKKILFGVVAFSAAACMVGCVDGRLRQTSRYVSDGEVISGVAEEATVYDLDSGAQSLMAKMRAHQTFQRNYAELKALCKRTPVLDILPVTCNFSAPSSTKSRLNLVRDRVGVSLYESDLFVLRDTPLADAIGNLGAPDCLLRGSLTRIEERGGCFVYRLQFKLVEAKTARVLWDGEESVLKIDKVPSLLCK